MFLTTSERRKPKPLKLLLAALERNLAHSPFPAVRADLVAYVVSRAWQSISAQEEINAVKPLSQALQLFLSKSLVHPSDIIGAVSQGHLSLDQRQSEVAEQGRYDTPLDSFSVSRCLEHSHSFLYRTLAWLKYPDTARISSRLFSTFCYFMRIWSSSWPNSSTFEHTGYDHEPLWLSAFNSFLKSNPHQSDLLATHAIPEILRRDFEGTEAYLQRLQGQTVQSILGYGAIDLQINLLLLHRTLQVSSCKSIDKQTIQAIGAGLLCHISPQNRSAAFLLVTDSSSPKEFFTTNTLRALRHALPSYHAEVNPKIRHANVAMIRNLIFKMAFSLKSSKGFPNGQPASKPSAATEFFCSAAPIEPSLEGDDYKHQRDFLIWYFEFLIHELSPTASYQRHVVSLSIVEIFLSSTKLDIDGDKQRGLRHDVVEELLISLFDLVTNPFDDVRELASSILAYFPKVMGSWLRFGLSDQTAEAQTSVSSTGEQKDETKSLLSCYDSINTKALCRAKSNMRSTGRADHADGFGRLYGLRHGPQYISEEGNAWGKSLETVFDDSMSELNNCVAIAEDDLSLAVQAASLHGHLIATRYLVVQINQYGLRGPSDAAQLHVWRRLSHRLIEISTRVWHAAKAILCADAPEGHEIDTEVEINTKDLLSYCWRALKESSTLMHTMITGEKPTPFLRVFQHDHHRYLGELAFQQLAELRHRGAFSAVSQTFAECCLRCAQSDDSETRALPIEWYQKTLSCIQQRASALTRRSAGLPAMLTSILNAYPEGEFFDTVMRDLQKIADSAPNIKSSNTSIQLPQVHAFNCLKDIFTDSKFGESVEKHMPTSLDIAVRGLESDQWAIRNCGLMLLKALISRLNDGTNTRSSELSSSTRRLSSFVYDKYQNLPDLVLRLLTTGGIDERSDHLPGTAVPDAEVLRAQHVFPALEIIERSGVPKQHDSEIWQAIWTHLEGPIWSIREKAAKALSYLPVGQKIQHEMERCLQSSWPSQNALHGRQLYLRFLFARIEKDTPEPIQQVFLQVLDHFHDMITLNHCPITRSSYIALVTDVLSSLTSEGTALERSPIEGTNSSNYSRVGVTSSPIFSTVEWESFTGYLHQNTPTMPEFALEDAAKSHLRSMVDSLGEQGGQTYSPMVKVCQSIFMHHGPRDFPEDPEDGDRILRQSGAFLADWSRTVDEESLALAERLECWARALTLAQDENAEVSTRQAAVDSLANYLHLKAKRPTEQRMAPMTLKLYVILYDFLLDDDEDVRNTGAVAASEVFMSTASRVGDDAEVSIPLMVPAARQKLVETLKHSYHDSSYLWTEAVQRLVIGQHSLDLPRQSQFPSPRPLLHDLRKDDTALFVEEKQNLYVDEAQEASIWQEVMLSMDRSTVDSSVLAELGNWATKGLDALIEVAEKEEDGPLGWTSKPDVFTFGVRVLRAVQALLRLFEDERLDVDAEGLRARLGRLEEVGLRSCLRAAWMRIIRESIGRWES